MTTRPTAPTAESVLTDAIRWLLTEMPVGWEDIAEAEGRADVVATVRRVVQIDGSDAP